MEEPGGLQSMGSLGVGHDWATSLFFSLFCTGRRILYHCITWVNSYQYLYFTDKETEIKPAVLMCTRPHDGKWGSSIQIKLSGSTMHIFNVSLSLSGVGCHFLLQCIKVKSESEVIQSCPTLRDPMDCSLPGSSAHGILQVKRTGVGCHCLLVL